MPAGHRYPQLGYPQVLTEKELKNAKPRGKPYKLAAGGGLHLLIKPSGSRLWRLKYRVDGREKLLSFGMYPEVSLKLARERRDEARLIVRKGIDPAPLTESGSMHGRGLQHAKALKLDTFAR